ncbi:MAG: Stp1/IreP family PP2C-type Ser/Thr phosphatase [Chlamydiales bacterium]
MLDVAFQFDYIGMSDVGLVREQNEDIWAAFPEIGVFLLADGMGGHASGEIAAKEAVDFLSQLIREWDPSKETTLELGLTFFREAVQKMNHHIFQESQADPSLKGMGTTLCALHFFKFYAILAHVGDSRIYLQRGSKLNRLTEDHSLVSELVEMEAMKAEDAQTFPYKHVLTRAIGTHPVVEPTLNSIIVEPHDLFMLCSDGLTNYVSDKEIAETLATNDSLKAKGQQLINAANNQGGGDNITLILVDVVNDLPR